MSRPRPRPALTRQRVVAAALSIVDRDGLDKLTMRALGRELGVDPMAVYHHVPNKGAILDRVVEAVWSELDLPEVTDEPWQVQLDRIARSMRDTLRRHPHALPVLASRPNLSIPGFRLTDRIVGLLLGAGLPAREALEFVNAAGEFLLGHALAEAGPSLPGAQRADSEVLASLDEASAAEEFPHLARALADVDLRTVTMDRIFDAGLAVLQRGLEQRLKELADDGTAGPDD